MIAPSASADTGVKHERIGAPSTCTVQAPHKLMPQPNFVPLSSSSSRNTQSNGVFGSTSTLRLSPFTFKVNLMPVS